MTEFEAATLAYQYAGLWVASSVGVAQCLLIGLGLGYMRRASDHRDKQHAETVTAQQQQHADITTALTAAIAALKQQGEALRVVIERTEPAGRN